MFRKNALTLCLAILLVSGCAARAPKLDHEVALGPIKEYDEKVAIKPIEPQKSGNEARPEKLEEPVKPVPKLGLEPNVKLELKGKKRKKKSLSLPEVAVPEEAQNAKRQPELEESVGFAGRRPLVDPFHVGEKVTLMLTYFGVSAGDTTLEVRPYVELNGRKAYHFYSSMKSSSVFSMFYKVDDFGEAYMDFAEMVPLTFTMSATETKQLREARQFFDWKNKKARFWERAVTKENGVQERKKEWDLVPYSQNIYTAVQYVRCFQLQDGKTYAYHVSDDGRTWDVRATVVRREILKTDLGNFKTVVVKPEVATEGVLKAMGEVFFWYTDDERHFPIKFEAKIKIGKIIGYLKALDKGT